ncbi:MAG TPA: hypothetical protein VH680_17440 [Gemmatimonadales bacterium]
MRWVAALVLTANSIAQGVVHAQALDVRPTPFTEPRTGNQARHGEVVLGQTTLSGTRRMFAELLSSDSIKVARGHQGNPSPIPAGTVWQVASHRVQPSYKLDLGPDRYTLYYDKNERLIAAIAQDLPGALTKADLLVRYPTLRKGRRWYSGNQARSEQWTTAVETCVTLVASLLLPQERLEQLSYIYTCPTQKGTPRL